MKSLFVGLVVLSCACRSPEAAPAETSTRPAQRRPVIDMHLHADLPPMEVKPGAPSLCRPAPCAGPGRATANDRETLEQTLEAMKRHQIVKAFLSGIDPAVVDTWVKAAPERFIAGQFILQPGKPGAAALRERLKAKELGGLGEIAAQLAGIPPNDPRLEPYFALAEEADVPVLVHTLGIGPELPAFRVAAGNPLLLEDVLVRHPRLRIWVENSGYPFRDEMIAMMSQYPNLYGDVSTITWVVPRSAFYEHLEALVQAGLARRIMWGSDQMRWPDRIGEGIAAVEQAPFLNDAQKRDILHDNAARFLRLKEPAALWQSEPGSRPADQGLAATAP